MPGTTEKVEWVTPAWVSHKTGISYKSLLRYCAQGVLSHARGAKKGSSIHIRWPLEWVKSEPSAD